MEERERREERRVRSKSAGFHVIMSEVFILENEIFLKE